MLIQRTKLADRDLVGIFRYTIQNHGYEQAKQYLSNFQRTCDVIGDNPEAVRLREDLVPPVRMYPFRKHLIVYQVLAESILIVRVLHERMDVSGHHLDLG